MWRDEGHVRARTRRPQSAGVRGGAMTRWLWGALCALVASHCASLASSATRRIHLYGWDIQLTENQAIQSPLYKACKFYKGRVVGEDNSVVTLTDCDGQLYGLIRVNEENFVLEPKSEGADEPHVLRRRDVMLAELAPAYSLSEDTVDALELDIEEDLEPARGHIRALHGPAEIDYFQNLLPVSRPLSGVQDLWLELAVVADHTMVNFHGHSKVKHYILALMNIVSAIFSDPSLGANITLVINKLFLYEEPNSLIKYGNVKSSLESVNKWNYRRLAKLPPGEAGWDATVWLTREELGGPSGFAAVGGVCTRTKSAAIDRDEGLTSAFVIAHELAHLLGLSHDGNGTCDNEAHEGSVMAPTVLATLHNFAWSVCSKNQLRDKSKNWSCLHQRSGDAGVELGGSKELSHYVFTMDEQCRTEFGDGFSVCRSVRMKSPCARLWCAHRALPHVCRSKRSPPLEGTPCKKNHWCVDRVCSPMPGFHGNHSESEDMRPQWEEWTSWSDCNAECGYGLKTRTRMCVKGNLVVEGACEGASTQAATCYAGKECAGFRDLRADICRRQDEHFIPYLHQEEAKSCEVWCLNYTGGDPSSFGTLPDGTPCNYDRPYDLCFQGTCVKGQCNSMDPACNWCADGYCSNNTLLYTRRLSKGWTRLSVIPHDAHQLSAHISTLVPLEISLRERRRDKPTLKLSKLPSKPFKVQEDTYLKYDTHVPQNLRIVEFDSNVIDLKEERFGQEGSVIVAGAVLEWRQTDNDVYLTSKSKLQNDLMILASQAHFVSVSEAVSVQVSVNYSTSSLRTAPTEYRSWLSTRGACSVTCGGGVRAVRTRCVRGRCLTTRYERCNTHGCELKWAPGDWEECSATCGEEGVQERQIFCVPTNISTYSRRVLIEHSVSPVLCSLPQPEKVQPCNRLPCPVYWEELPWTPCSKTCGRGISIRPLHCPATSEVYCGPKPRERRRRCRLRRCPSTEFCHTTDKTNYCELFDTEQLIRNCILPPFRKVCCSTCKRVMHKHHI